LGEPVVVSDLDPGDPGTVAELGERIMAALTGLVAGIRGEPPPAGRFDLRLGRRVPGARPGA
ncbi:MAG: 1-acyl-sn-glycerol-3-phosphate acyltransferase, partial [Propionicimonas sp.]|nr:1-acyl-sn-glycerol-3-phosphate acyltransferase [Propionicimonas sp.]